MRLEAMYCNSKVVNEIECEIGGIDGVDLLPFGELEVRDIITKNPKWYFPELVLYKPGGEFFVEGKLDTNIASYHKEQASKVHAKGYIKPKTVLIYVPVSYKLNPNMPDDYTPKYFLIAGNSTDNFNEGEHLVYEDFVYKIVKGKRRGENGQMFTEIIYMLQQYCSIARFYELHNLDSNFFNLI
jgi:hypothetical protein